ncbi:hypothetical protein [Roseateles sp. L2-2]|uniref:hypothetical protein n=1 Tax=Roseateles sp. L2-2 TaxID=3422597 RepID=UPI003D362A46
MTSSAVDERLAQAARSGPAAYYPAVIEATREIHARLTAPDKLAARIYGGDVARLKDLLRVSVILNDYTSVGFNGPGDWKVTLPEPQRYLDMFGTEQLRFNVSREVMEANALDLENPMLGPCFLYSGSSAQRPLMTATAEFIESGNVMFQPSRGLVSKKAAPNSWHVMGVDAKQPLDVWEPDPEATGVAAARPPRMEIEGPGTDVETLFEVTLPFLSGIPLRHLHGMHQEEQDLILAFRAAIRAAIRESKKSSLTAAEVVADVVQPKVAQIDRKLKSLRRVHGLKVAGAAVGTFALAFSAFRSAELVSGLLTLASASGVGILANQGADYLAKRDEVAMDPYYFLWKVRRARSTK